MGDPASKPELAPKPKKPAPGPTVAPPSPPPKSPPGGNALLVEQIRVARDALESEVLSDAGRAMEQTTLDAELAQLDATGGEARLTPDQRAIVDSARAELGRERGAPAVLDLPSKKERLAKVSPLVRLSVEQIDDGASGKVMLAEAVANHGGADLKRWALELQSFPHAVVGNYLHQWYLLLRDDYPDIATMFAQRFADMGILIGPSAHGFTSVEHIDPKEPLPRAMAPDVEK